MNEKQKKKISKFLSLVLRHKPEEIGIELDDQGWVSVSELLDGLNRNKMNITIEMLQEVVVSNDKQRFVFSDDESQIRANQGHSVSVELGYEEAIPPQILRHGTPEKFVSSIMADGLLKMQRHHVHLHVDIETSIAVGARRGKPVLLEIRSEEMHRDGFRFYVTPNNVWLTDHVPAKYIQIAKDQ